MSPRGPECFAYSALRRGQIRVLHSRLVNPLPLPGWWRKALLVRVQHHFLPVHSVWENLFSDFSQCPILLVTRKMSHFHGMLLAFHFHFAPRVFSKVTLLFLAYRKGPKGSHTLFFYDAYLLIPSSKVGCVSTL